jgi:RimJ/RimL family protein N-acetyltransferase
MVRSLWPLFNLRLTSGDLVLQPLQEADLDEVIPLVPSDLELDPGAFRFDADETTQRGLVILQQYWRYYGAWTPASWRVTFAVRRDGELLGLQELEGQDFAQLRVVDTASWLTPLARGRGVGRRMRRCVLALAFGPLQARTAVTSAWHDNHASLGVSRSLGYSDNGVSTMARGDGADTLVHLRLTQAEWQQSGAAEAVTISGFDPCRFLFGLTSGTA